MLLLHIRNSKPISTKQIQKLKTITVQKTKRVRRTLQISKKLNKNKILMLKQNLTYVDA